MYIVNEAISVDLGNGRSVYLAPGPRGVQEIRTRVNGPVSDRVDLDANLRAAVPAKVLARLIAEGKITEQ